MRRGGLPGKARDPGGRSSPNVRNQNLVRAALHHQQTVIHLWLHYGAVWELHHYFLPAHNGKWNHFNRRCDDYSSQEMFFCSIFCFPSFSAFYNLVFFLSCLVSSYLPRLFMCPTRVLLSRALTPPWHRISICLRVIVAKNVFVARSAFTLTKGGNHQKPDNTVTVCDSHRDNIVMYIMILFFSCCMC